MERGGIALAIRRPVGVLVGVILVLLFGGLSLSSIPIQLTPDVVIPTITVRTAWPGAAPAEVEREIVEEQEKVLKSIPGLVRMTGEARAERGTLTLELEVGTPLEEALVRVSNALTQVPAYPETTREPVVATASSTGPPLAVVIVRSRSGQPVAQYRTWVEEEVLPRLERIPGVGDVRIHGGRVTEVVVEFDPEALAARGVPIEEMVRAIRAELTDLSGGDVDLGKRRYVVRTLVRPDEVSRLEGAVLRVEEDGTAVRLGDVATVSMGLRKRSAFVFGNGTEALAMIFSREAGSNVLEVTEELREAVDRVGADLLEPRGLEIAVTSDQTGYIRGALRLVRNNILLGGGLAILTLLLFLRSVSASSVVATAIPVCVVGTSLGMALLGRTVNVVSLAGMAFAVGMVVDNAIVVLESIDTWRGEGTEPRRAALEGTREVWGAIVASTLTTAAVFIPVVLWRDEVGELLRDVALAVSVAVFLSLVVSVLVIPSFSARLLRAREERAAGVLVRAGSRFRDGVGSLAGWIGRSWLVSAGLALGIPGFLLLVSALLLPPMEYLPSGQRNMIFGVLVTPPGYSVAELTRVGEVVQSALHASPEAPAVGRSFFVARPGGAFMGASAADPEEIDELLGYTRGVVRGIPGVFGAVNQASLFGRRLGAGRSVDVEITGSELPVLVEVGGQLMGALSQALPDAQIRPIPSLDLGSPELHVLPRREQAAAQGLSGAEIGLAVDAMVDGRIVGELGREGEPQVDVVIRPRGEERRTPSELEAAVVATPRGRVVPLGTVAEVRESTGPATIERIERRRAITLQVTPPEDLAVEEAVERIREEVVAPMQAGGRVPEAVRIDLAGAADKLEVAKARMGRTLLLAVLISFLLMAALFEDFLAPLVILVTMPMAAAGGVAGLRLVDLLLGPQPLDMMTALGFVILIGVVVNNAILVVHGALARLRGGGTLEASIQWAVRRRVRPIFMSTCTSLAALTPLVLFPGSGSELYRGVGAVVLGGLALSTVLTLVVVPAVFSLTWRLARRA